MSRYFFEIGSSNKFWNLLIINTVTYDDHTIHHSAKIQGRIAILLVYGKH